MSDTPITDFEKQTLEEWIKEYDGLMIPEEDKKPWYLVHEVTAQKLERERNEASEKLNTNLTEISNKLVVAMRELDEAREECKEAQYESDQQSRLLGISAEREYALRGKIFELERKILQLEAK